MNNTQIDSDEIARLEELELSSFDTLLECWADISRLVDLGLDTHAAWEAYILADRDYRLIVRKLNKARQERPDGR